jgi:hypothetical protein
MKPLLLAAALLCSPSVFAKGGACKALAANAGMNVSACKCGGELQAPRRTKANALALVATCASSETGWGSEGDFLYEGSQVFTGRVKREDTETFGDTISFWIDKELIEESPFAEPQFSFLRGIENAIRQFGTPPISARSPCWVAPSTIVVKSVYISRGVGLDSEGMFPMKYEVLSVGKFAKCKPNT